MPQDEWKTSIDSLTKDIEELRKELLTERVKNLPDMIQNMVKTARDDMEVRIKEIQENIRQERVMIDDRVAQVDNKIKDLDKAITKIESRDKKVEKFVDNYAGSLTEVKNKLKETNDGLNLFRGEMKSKFNSINKEVDKITTFSEQIESSIKRSFEVKREWGKVVTKFDRMEKVFKEVTPQLKKGADADKKLRTWVAENRKSIEGTKAVVDEIFVIRDRLNDKMLGIEEFRKEVSGVVGQSNEMLRKVEVNDAVINQFKESISNMDDISRYIGEVNGKLSELEHYFKDPKALLGEQVELIVRDKMDSMGRTITEATSSLESSRDYIRREFIQIMIISKLTEVANAEVMADMNSNMRSLEFLVSEAIRMEIWNSDLERGVLDTLSSTRDFWEARKPELSGVLQKSIDSIESQIKRG
jgi:chromosome segregation ATPase